MTTTLTTMLRQPNFRRWIIAAAVALILAFLASHFLNGAGVSNTGLMACIFQAGTIVRCADTGDIYVSTGTDLRQFSPEGYAAAGKPAYANTICSQIAACPKGREVRTDDDVADLVARNVLKPLATAPCTFGEGKVVRCDKDGAIYVQHDGQLRQFTGPGYMAAGTPAYETVECDLIESCQRGSYVDAADVPALHISNDMGFCSQGAWGETPDAVYGCETEIPGRGKAYGRWGWGANQGQCCSCDMSTCYPSRVSATTPSATPSPACKRDQCLLEGRCYDEWGSAPSNFYQCRVRGTNKYGRWGWGENEGKCCNCDFSDCKDPQPA